jgi:hypothetical protein
MEGHKTAQPVTRGVKMDRWSNGGQGQGDESQWIAVHGPPTDIALMSGFDRFALKPCEELGVMNESGG